jgi:hypothetical protein
MQKCNYLLQKNLSSWPLSQAPFQWEGTGPRPSSLKLSDSGHTPFHHREGIEKKRQIPRALIQKAASIYTIQVKQATKNTAPYVVDTEQTLGEQRFGCVFGIPMRLPHE